MSLVINHNLMAMSASRYLGISYDRLSTSVSRLASGLRINSAADDAAGLAIREMMRTDIRVLNQGVRNANDALSLIQTADGALSVIDEKLTRMKELAEQAATGTYTSAQRLIMDSEYQAMASEITRIAMATDFNGVKLLDGSLSGTTGQMKIHFGTGNNSAEDYYYININSATASALGVGNAVAAGTAGATISTQAAAQLALEAIDSAISDKDNVRANLGRHPVFPTLM
jgi:flagellin